MTDADDVQPTPAARRSVPAGLPAAGTHRWVAHRKALVVEAVHAGRLALEDACRLYDLSPEEFASWEKLIDSHGIGGLRVAWLKRSRGRRRTARTS